MHCLKNILLPGSKFLLTALLLFTCHVYGEEYQWEKVKDKNSIEIFTRPVNGSRIKECLAVTMMRGRLSSVLAVFNDTASYTRWMYRCSEATLLLKKNSYERIIYSVISSPWPVADRDIVVKSSLVHDRNTGVVTVTINGLPDYVAIKPGRVRMRGMNGCWVLEPRGNGWIKISYRIHSDPGGSLPDKLVNSSIVDIPYNTLYNLRKMAGQYPYKDAVFQDIIEK